MKLEQNLKKVITHATTQRRNDAAKVFKINRWFIGFKRCVVASLRETEL